MATLKAGDDRGMEDEGRRCTRHSAVSMKGGRRGSGCVASLDGAVGGEVQPRPR